MGNHQTQQNLLKAPITTPQGGGYKSWTLQPKFLGLYSNVRPCKSLHPFVSTKHPDGYCYR
jgi:isocitrate dehydrogenase